MGDDRTPSWRQLQAVAGRRRQRAMAEMGAKPRAVRRALARMTRGGRKGARAAIRVAAYEAGVRVEGAERAKFARRARDSRAGRMPHVKAG